MYLNGKKAWKERQQYIYTFLLILHIYKRVVTPISMIFTKNRSERTEKKKVSWTTRKKDTPHASDDSVDDVSWQCTYNHGHITPSILSPLLCILIPWFPSKQKKVSSLACSFLLASFFYFLYFLLGKKRNNFFYLVIIITSPSVRKQVKRIRKKSKLSESADVTTSP